MILKIIFIRVSDRYCHSGSLLLLFFGPSLHIVLSAKTVSIERSFGHMLVINILNNANFACK